MSKLGILLLVAIFATATNAEVLGVSEVYYTEIVPDMISMITGVNNQLITAYKLFEERQSLVIKYNNDNHYFLQNTHLDFVGTIYSIIKKKLEEPDKKINVTECIQLIESFAETLTHAENNARVCRKNEVENGTEYYNSIVELVEHTFDIIDINEPLYCNDNHKEYTAVLECMRNVTDEARAIETKSKDMISTYTAQFVSSGKKGLHDCSNNIPLPPSLSIEKSKLFEKCEQSIGTEALTPEVSAQTTEGVVKTIGDFHSLYLGRVIHRICDSFMRPITKECQEILVKTETKLDELRASIKTYEDSFHNDKEVILQTLRKNMDEIKEKLPEFDENAEYIDINALYANTSFIICINKDLASAYFNREKMIKKIINLQMDVGRTCRKVQAPIREKNFDVALAHAIDVLENANSLVSNHMKDISMMSNEIDFLAASVKSSFRNCKKENLFLNGADTILKRLKQSNLKNLKNPKAPTEATTEAVTATVAT